ncbi:SGNH/GDSL hydrolase family protein [Nocardia sp. NPDC005366]|uniref:SGNH/GDSL hydrolase family protein n=1 Tax=Nocardia sp. NPDC005366 TaxID=3156878 RepID=UPI0033AB252E
MEPNSGSWTSYSRYVALGDSQTEGIGDPDGMGGHRGWADRFAELLDAAYPGLHYANLAVRGRRAGQIRDEQLESAVALDPDLVTVMAGMNDLIRPRFDRKSLLTDLDIVFGTLIDTGATVVTFTYPDIGGVAPLVRPLSPRIYALNDDLRMLAEEHGVVLIDVEPVEATAHPLVWADDRLHLNPLGHDLVARAVADALALPGSGDTWRDPLPRTPSTYWHTLAAESVWATRYLLPWVGRRLRGHSAGTGLYPKRPDLLPVLL